MSNQQKNFINYSNILSNNLPYRLSENNKITIEKKINKNKSSIILTKIDADYKAASIIKFLSFLHSHGGIDSEVRIVSHNNIMTKLLELLDTNNNKIKNIYKNQNLWSILLNLDDKKINITRHGFSISNLYKETGEIFKQIQYQDPELSLYGTLSALLHSKQISENEEKNGFITVPYKIYVSTLIRSWMTAICLYLPYFAKLKESKKNLPENFTLIISPYIKEVDKSQFSVSMGISKDNTPNDFNIQIENILKFLNYLIKMSEHFYNNKYLQDNLSNIVQYFKKKNELIIINDNKKERIHIMMDTGIKIDKRNKINTNKNFNLKYISDKPAIINNIMVFNGINKPSKKIIKNNIIKPCERFSKIYSNQQCNIMLKKIPVNLHRNAFNESPKNDTKIE